MWREHKDENLPSWLSAFSHSPTDASKAQVSQGDTGGIAQESTPLLSSSTANPPPSTEGSRKPNTNTNPVESDEEDDPFACSVNQKQTRPKQSKRKQSKKKLDKECTCNRFCYNIFVLINTIAILCQFGMLLGQVLSTVYVHSDVLQIALRVYIGLFCIAFIGLEADLCLQSNAILHTYWSRGIVYSFVGLVGVEQSIALRVDMLHTTVIDSMWSQTVSLLLHLSSWIMVCLGALYFFMGIFCLQILRDRVFKEEEKREERYKWEEEHELEVE